MLLEVVLEVMKDQREKVKVNAEEMKEVEQLKYPEVVRQMWVRGEELTHKLQEGREVWETLRKI